MDHRINPPNGWERLDASELSWLVIEKIWDWMDFYGEYEPFRLQMSELTPGQRAVYSTQWLSSEVSNGGFHQFFFNSTGMLGPEAVDGFRLLGLPELAARVLDAFRFAGLEPYVRAREERCELLPDYDDRSSEWYALNEKFYEASYDSTSDVAYDRVIPKRQAAYVRAHPHEFFR